MICGPFYSFLPGASLLSDVTYVHNVLATSLISLLHTVLDGGPRKWTYEDPSKPMTYQQDYMLNSHKNKNDLEKFSIAPDTNLILGPQAEFVPGIWYFCMD